MNRPVVQRAVGAFTAQARMRVLGGGLQIAAASPPSVHPARLLSSDMRAVARANFKRWNDALQTKDPKAVARLYSAGNLSFLPTVFSLPLHISSPADAEKYFSAFLERHPFGTITDDSVQVFDNGNAFLHSGLYTFELGEGTLASPRVSVDARFSYVWRLEDGVWTITHHHSSLVPVQ